MFWSYLYSASTQHGNLHQLSATMNRGNRCQSQPTQEKLGRSLGKMQVNVPEWYKLARKKSLAVGVACMAIYWPAPGLKGGIFENQVFNRWDLKNQSNPTNTSDWLQNYDSLLQTLPQWDQIGMVRQDIPLSLTRKCNNSVKGMSHSLIEII